ncbi:MAG TPA: hypothetical protein VEX68_10150 [Bryobacteraceae bacterium]|nr:hypothetical protein [Bryobacteraceae bacterium]
MGIAVAYVAVVRNHCTLLNNDFTVDNDRDTMTNLGAILENQRGDVICAATRYTEIAPKRDSIADMDPGVTVYLRQSAYKAIRAKCLASTSKQGFAIEKHIRATA